MVGLPVRAHRYRQQERLTHCEVLKPPPQVQCMWLQLSPGPVNGAFIPQAIAARQRVTDSYCLSFV